MARLSRAFSTAFFLAAGLSVTALELDLGAGAKVDVAPYGIENITALAFAASWIGPREGIQAGLVTAGSTGRSKTDLELSACLRVWPVKDAVALFGGAGYLAEAAGPGPSQLPFLIGALRLEAGDLALLACAEVHFEGYDTDTMFWLAALWRVR